MLARPGHLLPVHDLTTVTVNRMIPVMASTPSMNTAHVVPDPAPARKLRRRLAARRAQGFDFDAAWADAVAHALDGAEPGWVKCFEWSRNEWEAGYARQPLSARARPVRRLEGSAPLRRPPAAGTATRIGVERRPRSQPTSGRTTLALVGKSGADLAARIIVLRSNISTVRPPPRSGRGGPSSFWRGACVLRDGTAYIEHVQHRHVQLPLRGSNIGRLDGGGRPGYKM